MLGFDVISDLRLEPSDPFDWEGKATSLYCIVAGNISSDIGTVYTTLAQLSKMYHGIFFVAGDLEYSTALNLSERTLELSNIIGNIRNVAFLHNHVVIINGVAIVGATGWYGHVAIPNTFDSLTADACRFDDLKYLSTAIERLQLHADVQKIVVVTNSVPAVELYFGEEADDLIGQFAPNLSLVNDTEIKVSHWVYGSYNKAVDVVLHNVHYVNNAFTPSSPYWAKRIDI